ncbi:MULTISPECIES: nucleosidase [Rhodococcus]|jgi:purine nucleosidase/adenosylhomocysteine nucleosidase|uniref:Nucleosidase n=1 Tax=Rhodococcus oxybenzonivorans TaxID=1990687 RepID=A0AAE5A4Z5_9NOCA|nr:MULTISPECIES: nucleosidase [Rhodococcus]MDV7244712.1 nucleosidase [Rhodococcus oxybenzonivorans]MDV7264082.1 nucleosidase [Rhodococcus oxybenzonivorans]MDV7275789.1 nucleosidase [Rhodococcus oxybenzonivorans]MDV7332566.1 nucleosidase [Rhodococcus oxybenzonivorans]MDV7346362.1 nucleosidase [Rhodococcus oxybenzonivorans]
MSRSDILVVSATKAEAVHVPPEFDVLLTGIGKVSAAVAVAKALGDYPSSQKPLVVNIGTAGALHEHHSGLFTPSTVLNHDISGDAIRALGHEVADRLEMPEGDGSVLATGDVFVSDAGVRDVLAERADLVDMEGFAVAYACAQVGAQCRLVKHVSDTADDSALDWPARIDASARELALWLRAL